MAIITTYPDDTVASNGDKYLTVDESGATKLTSLTTMRSGVLAPGSVGSDTLAQSAVATATNTGNGGGTMRYLNIFGMKILWGKTNALTFAANATVTAVINFPPSFFSAVRSHPISPSEVTGFSSSQILISTNAPTTSAISIYATNIGTQSGTAAISYFIIGS